MDAPHISLFSTPLISTWVFDETHRILFDAGDGVTALLDSRIHKVRLAAITHTHRDHCAGLMQFLNLRGGAGDFTTIYPEASGAGNGKSELEPHGTGRMSDDRTRTPFPSHIPNGPLHPKRSAKSAESRLPD